MDIGKNNPKAFPQASPQEKKLCVCEGGLCVCALVCVGLMRQKQSQLQSSAWVFPVTLVAEVMLLILRGPLDRDVVMSPG